MMRKMLLPISGLLLATLLSCSSLSGIKGKFSEPIKGKALSITVRRVSGMGLHLGVLLEIANPSNAKVLITPLKVKVIHEDGTESETTYDLKRKSLQEIEIKGGEILSGILGVANPNQSEQVQPGAPASLSKGENVTLNLLASKSDPDKVQVSIGQDGSKEQEVFAISK